jgi:beta-glucosidase
MATLYHWDLPQALQARGGWLNRETATHFADYAAFLFRHLGDQVRLWVTINEPFICAFFGHVIGRHAPGRRRFWEFLIVAHHLLLAHGLAVRAFRHHPPPSPPDGAAPAIGIVLNLWPNHPASSSTADVHANQRFDLITNRLFLELLFHGRYPARALDFYARRLMWPPVRPDDLALIGQPIDFLGINTYSRLLNRAARFEPLLGVRQVRPVAATTAMGWEIYPPCTHEAPLLAREYTDTPLYITENGAAFEDRVLPDGRIEDGDRIAYLREHITQAQRAIEGGIDLRGYFVWSLLDNLEWEWGFRRRFGLIHVDFASGRRTPKRSAHWYRSVIARNGLAGGA